MAGFWARWLCIENLQTVAHKGPEAFLIDNADGYIRCIALRKLLYLIGHRGRNAPGRHNSERHTELWRPLRNCLSLEDCL